MEQVEERALEDAREKDGRHVLQTYARAPLVLVEGRGMTLTDSQGKTYLDFTAGIAVNALGHADPEIVAAVQEQVAQLGHVSNLFHSAPQANLAEMLCDLSFAERVFFSNSGSEANEAALKIARKYAQTMHHPGKNEVVAFTGSFHGRTMGSLALTAREKYQAPFRPLMPGAVFAAFNDVEAAQRAIGPATCAVFVEPVQGEGGIHAATPGFLRALREACDRWGALLVFDEIQCGIGRTGKLWAYQHSGVEPDMMTLAKALGGGLPIGATLLRGKVAEVMHTGDHGSTFGAGPVVCRAAQVVLRRVSDPDLLAHVAGMGSMLKERLTALSSPHVREVRGLGLMIGLELDIEAAPVIERGLEHGLLLLSAGPNVIRLLPPLIVEEEHISRLVEFLEHHIDG